ncbi:hypothetical protein [Pseudarthrobacter sp. ATCC 49987]|uniref:hypothetical protein n=1 Tax=Pseudarthrobacter sp. ATCC 49987 TaxID=2698204 RepID=UPI00136B4335|nr:hypothetical protein [Pseudarthrobacter sp. ATCC 49987]
MAKNKEIDLTDEASEKGTKRQYFFPTEGKSVEAEDLAEAVEILNEAKKEQEVGDGNR